ncbi:MAG TPA: MerR family transcriptional regulator [Mycobacteriales bacterium]|jgi:DNA-binding transcriptional MerR regulator|nr:MerR family transcriptional regulator [Mycobacteriales bacterium]
MPADGTAPRDASPEPDALDIDTLAQRAGTTVRTVRMYQERGLLPPPIRRGRRAAYGEEHLIRLRLVQRLADRGYSLAAVKDLTAAWDAQHGLAHVLGLEGAVAEPLLDEPPRRYTVDELTALFPGDEELAGLGRALEIGLLVAEGEEFLAPNPGLVDAGAQLVAAGMPLEVALGLAAATLAAADGLAERFVAAFVEHIWQPFEQAGEPDADAPAMAREIREKRALAVRAVASVMANAMDAHTDRVIMSRPPQR